VSPAVARHDVVAASHHEIELKLHVPPARADAVKAAVKGRSTARRTRLQAGYVDTPDHALAAAGMGWRVRREGRRWVQTLKAQLPGGPDGLHREEHNVPVVSKERPVADAALHDGTPVGERLRDVLRGLDEPPSERFHTDVWRTTRTTRAPGGQVELAFDEGVVASADRSLAICELEIELVSGHPRAVIAAARQWAPRHGLWLDLTTKAQRGVMLSRGDAELAVVKGVTASLHREMSVDAAVREMVRACTVQVLANASAVASGLGGHEHIHQTRVGIRKLRTVLGQFGSYTPAVDPSWSGDLADVFKVLGASRDRDVVLAGLLGELEAAGAPALSLPPIAGTDPADVLRGVDFTTLMLDLLDYAHGEPLDDDLDLRKVVAHRLTALRKKSLKYADDFDELAVDDQHDVRKQLKRLRYVSELTSSLFKAKKVAAFVATLEPAQDALGRLNDLVVATEVFRELTVAEPEAWFAVGWLSTEVPEAAAHCVPPLRRAKKATPHWKHD
jgi:inorganic triphosphatase YgiF